MVGNPLAGLGGAQVQQALIGRRSVQNPFWMFCVERTGGHDPFGLKPEDRANIMLGSMVANRPDSAGKTVGHRFPHRCVPAGIHPPGIQFNAPPKEQVDRLLLILFGRLVHPVHVVASLP